nr:serine/arginine repetitive matrix protein 2-like [Rhipicephalus microplus]
MDFCKECGRLSHRPDVYPRPDIKLCPICGLKNPINGHKCTPQCRICGEAHPTADRMCEAKYNVPHIVKHRRRKARFRDFRKRSPSPSDSNAGALEKGRPNRSRSRTRSQQVTGRSTRSGSPSPVKRRSKSSRTSRSRSRSRSRSENRHHPQQDIGGARPGGKQKGLRQITWRDTVTGTKADSAQGHPLSGRPQAAADPGLAARMENMEKENRELRQEFTKARKQNEKSTRKIKELQQTLNEILKRMGGYPAEIPSSGTSSSHEAADECDTTSAVGDGDTEMGCGGE